MAKKPRSKRASGRGKPPPAESAHARRVRLYLEKHPGASRAQARGHKPAEHATRKAKARREKRLTENERAAIRRYVRAQAKAGRIGDDEVSDLAASTIAWAQEQGYRRAFERMRDTRDRLKKTPSNLRVRKLKDGTTELVGDLAQRDRNIDVMDDFMDEFAPPDVRLLWYK